MENQPTFFERTDITQHVSINEPQKYLRTDPYRGVVFQPETEGVPTWFEVFSCVILAGCAGVVLSVVLT
jgi:hypothetical protein